MTDADFDYEKVGALVKLALVEDIGTGDVTSEATVAPGVTASMNFVARQKAVLAGLALLEPLYRQLSRDITCELLAHDGDLVRSGQTLAVASGPARALLTGERVALNFLQRLSGIATLTSRFVKAAAGTPVEILDTRKTAPGLRILEKYAVRMGGGHNHRTGLFDQVLIKDNHLRCVALRPDHASLADVVKTFRERVPGMTIEVEVEKLDALDEALDAAVDVVMLDNMDLEQIRTAVARVRASRRPPIIECSGNVTLKQIPELAATGVDRISIGRLTHSAPAVDISANIEDIRLPKENS